MKAEKTKLSVNVNKVATLRNARGKNTPDLLHIAKKILKTRAHGITIHPRPDERHIRKKDIPPLKALIETFPGKELNIEGYPGQKFLKLVKEMRPRQCTLVPDPPEVLTSNAGWDFEKNKDRLKAAVKELRSQNIRSSLFLDPFTMNEEQYSALKEIQPDRIEFYTESYAESFGLPEEEKVLSLYKDSWNQIQAMGISANAGHDLNQKNLLNLLKALPGVKEVSIGQALIAEALEEGLDSVIKKYLSIIDQAFSN